MTSHDHPHRPVVVVGYDGSDTARAAIGLAVSRLPANGRLVVVHGFTEPADYRGAPFYDVMLADSTRRSQELMAELEDVVPALRGIDWVQDVMHTAPADAILRAAEVNDATEIVIGTRGTGRLRSLLGSVAHDVVHAAACPVVLIPAQAVPRGAPESAEAVHA